MTPDIKDLAARLARECGAIEYRGTVISPPMYTITDDQLETLVRRAIEEHEKASAEGRAVAKPIAKLHADGYWTWGDDVPPEVRYASEMQGKTYTVYHHPASIDDIRRAAADLGYMLCRWEPIETAPRDGTKIILAKFVGHPEHESGFWWAARGFWSSRWNNWNDGVEPCGFAGPTHWLSGLTAPKEQRPSLDESDDPDRRYEDEISDHDFNN